MSTTLPPPGAQGGSPLDGPPPPAAMIPAQGQGQGSGYNGLAQPGEDPQKKAMQGLAEAFQTVDQILMTAAASLPGASQEFGAARKLIEQGLAKGLASLGQSPETSATASGAGFPGGGFSSISGIGGK